MNLKRFHPQNMLFFSEEGIQDAVKTFLVRVNLVPAARHVIGWRGATDITYECFGWTARIKNHQGIFGLVYDYGKVTDCWIGGVFRLHYFPWPDEELIENYSVRAAFLTEENGYMKRVRSFLQHSEFAPVFHIADLQVAVHRSEQALLCGINALSEHQIIADDGINILKDGEFIQIVAPGAYDQKFPSFRIAYDFFHVFTASITFNLEESPNFLLERKYEGYEVHYDQNGKFELKESKDIINHYFCLGYGEGNFLTGFENLMANTDHKMLDEFIWQKGEAETTGYDDALWWMSHNLEEARYVDETSVGVDSRVPLVVVTGFLGSGKTSFIQSFIDFYVQRNRFVAVIQNEIGEIGLDGKLLEDEFAVTEIDEGCVCCSLIGSVKKAVSDILAQFKPDFIILETTGMANPFNLLDEMIELRELIRFDGITTIVDAANIRESVSQYDIAVHQIEAADVLMVNKADLVNEEKLAALKSQLRGLNLRAPVVTVEHGYVNPALLYGTDPDETEVHLDNEVTGCLSIDSRKSHIHDGLESRKLVLPHILHRKIFLSLIESFPVPAFRIKGIVRFEDYEKPCILQYVNGRYDVSESSEDRFDEPFLIVIGQSIGNAPLDNYFEKAAVVPEAENRNGSIYLQRFPRMIR
ncbi:MAG: CobW family GTP-binding protein [Thermodesulfobacteriota bacterium]